MIKLVRKNNFRFTKGEIAMLSYIKTELGDTSFDNEIIQILYIQSMDEYNFVISNEIPLNISHSLDNGFGIRSYSKDTDNYIYSNDFSENNVNIILQNASELEIIRSNYVNHIKSFKKKNENQIQIHHLIQEISKILTNALQSDLVKTNSDKMITLEITLKSEMKSTVNGFTNNKKNEIFLTAKIIIESKLEPNINSKNMIFFKEIDLEKFKNQLYSSITITYQNINKKMNAIPVNASFLKLPIIFAPGIAGHIFHEIIGHSLESDNINAYSPEITKHYNCKITNSEITFIDDPTLSNRYGSLTHDDNGNETAPTTLISNGKLIGYLSDEVMSYQLGVKNTCNARSESYKYRPTPRMSNTYIANGKSNPKEIYESIHKALLIEQISLAAIDYISDTYYFKATQNYIVESGKKTNAVDDLFLFGDIITTLNSIKLVGNDIKFVDSLCLSNSGLIPVSVGSPTILVSRLK